jgi:hypothetical protein
MSLPKNALYTNKVQTSYARNYQSQIQPQNGLSYNAGETIIVNVPTSPNIVMSGADTVLKCTLNFSNAAVSTANLDRGGIAGVIQRVRIFHGSTLLSDVDNYGNLSALMVTLQQSSDTVAGKMQILQGCGSHSGENLLNAADAGDHNFEYAFPLMSILTMTNSYVPLFALSGSSLRLEIQLVSSISKFITSTTALGAHSTKSLLSDVELVCNFMEISDSGMAIIKNASGGVVQWVVSDFRNYGYNATLQTSETQLSVPIPSKFNSLKSLFWSFRQNSAGIAARYPNESCKFGLKEYSLRIGSQTMPTKAPSSTSQFFSELLRSIGCVSDVNHETNFSKANYSADVPVAYAVLDADGNAVSSKSFYAGMDLESYSNCNSDSIYSGYNSSVDDIFWNPTFNGQASATNIRIDTYSMFDSLILIQDGVATVQY